MIRFLADENFNNAIIRGSRHVSPSLDIVRVQDVGLSGADDPSILEWAGAFFAAYNLRSELSEFFDAPYVVGERSVRTVDDSAWDRLWDRLLEDGDER